MVDTNAKSDETGQGKKGKGQKSKGTKTADTDKGETKKQEGIFRGLVVRLTSKFDAKGGTSSSPGAGHPTMGVNYSITGSSSSSKPAIQAATNENSGKKGSAGSTENANSSGDATRGNGTGRGGGLKKLPLEKSKVSQAEVEPIQRGNTITPGPSTNSTSPSNDPTDPAKPMYINPSQKGVTLNSSPTTGWPLKPASFAYSSTQGKPPHFSDPSLQNKLASNSESAPSTPTQEKPGSNSAHPTRESSRNFAYQTPASFVNQGPVLFSVPSAQGGKPTGTTSASVSDPHPAEKNLLYPALHRVDFNDQQSELGPSPMDVDEEEPGQEALDLLSTNHEHEPIQEQSELNNQVLYNNSNPCSTSYHDPQVENPPRPLQGQSSSSQGQLLKRKSQHSGHPIPVPPSYDSNGHGTYTPNETYVSELLWKILETQGDEYKAIFFSRYITPSNPPLPPLIPFSLNPEKWKSNDHFAPVPFTSEKRWEKIVRELTSLKNDCETGRPRKIGARVATAVTSYCKEADSYDFEILSGRNISKHVVATIPIIVEQALLLPNLLAKQIPLLECGQSKTLFVSKKLCCSLLANAFFSTFPPQRSNMPDINFHRLFSTSATESKSNVKAEKIMCILNYFHQITAPRNQEQFGNNIISYERRHQTQIPDWGTSKAELINVVVEPSKKIEEMEGMLQVDFANKVVGGGVLNDGAIMEEILFVISPELIVSRLFTETLEDNEVLVITGYHQFSEYEGYSASFAYKNPYQLNNVKTDNLGRLFTQMVAMDALHFKGDPKAQFRQDLIDRELTKSFVGFGQGPETNRPVATGNWGCGAFNGDTELKFLIQWLAATEAGRPEFHYHTVGDKQQASAMEEAIDLLKSHNVDTGKLYKLVVNFYSDRFDYGSIFQYIRDNLEHRFRTSL